MTTTFDRLKSILLKTYPVDPETLTDDRPLEELGLDSLGIGLLLFDVEDEFKIKFTSEPGRLKTVRDVVAYIDGRLTAPAGDGETSRPLVGR
jgi:acyl carrier protein